MKRRLVLFAAALSIGAVLSGCGMSTSPNETTYSETEEETERADETTAAIETEAAAEAETEAVQQKDENADDNGLLHPEIKEVELGGLVNAGDQFLSYSASVSSAVLSDEESRKYPDLALALNRQQLMDEAYANEKFGDSREFIEDTAADYAVNGGYLPSGELIDNYIAGVIRADSVVLSMEYTCENYEGGAHGDYSTMGRSYDTATGKIIELTDIITDMDGFKEAVKAEISANYPDIWPEISEDYLNETIDIMADPLMYSEVYGTDPEDRNYYEWAVGYDGLRVYFGHYVLGAYALGTQEINLGYEKYSGIFNEKYIKAPESYAAKLRAGEYFYCDTDNDGSLNEVRITEQYGENSNFYVTLDIQIDGNSNIFEAYGYGWEAYYVKDAEKDYLYIFVRGDNDIYDNYIFELGAPSERIGGPWGFRPAETISSYNSNEDSTYSSIYVEQAFTDPHDFMMSSRTDMLSTIRIYNSYHIDESGIPVTDGIFKSDGGQVLTALADVDATASDENGADYGQTVIPSGTEVRIVGTDDLSFALLMDDDGNYYKLIVDRSDWPARINGMNEDEVFSGIMYAG